MKILSIEDKDLTPKVATIGMFDGVHSGHKFLLNHLLSEAQNRDLTSLVVTFSNHPMLYFKPDSDLKLLTLEGEKVKYLSDSGVESCLVFDFNEQIQKLTSSEFLTLLRDNYGVRLLIVGYDHHFGSDKITDFALYQQIGDKLGVEIIRCNAFVDNSIEVSSSKIRKALLSGDIALANKYLDYKYNVSGVVIDGFKLGRSLGFPTANIDVDSKKLLPKHGAYAVRVQIGESEELHYAMMNIGVRPTFNGNDLALEAHLINFCGFLYNREIKIYFEKFLRGEIKFDTPEDLKCQLKKDLIEVKSFFNIE
ncbi:MAG: bifunctional riboflavin kinase/FAD synthetase [Bacteroidales bacterium]|nr:bifunctional riboflavin kinase/FAD synthetase [Bacteroidales bacterium]